MSSVGARQEKVQGNCEGTEKTEEAAVGRISESIGRKQWFAEQ